MEEDYKHHNSTHSLRTCHCAECCTNKIWRIITCTTKQSHSKKHSAKNNVLKVLQTWDCHTKHTDPVNHLIYWRLVRNDSSTREIVLIILSANHFVFYYPVQSEERFALFYTFDLGEFVHFIPEGDPIFHIENRIPLVQIPWWKRTIFCGYLIILHSLDGRCSRTMKDLQCVRQDFELKYLTFRKINDVEGLMDWENGYFYKAVSLRVWLRWRLK